MASNKDFIDTLLDDAEKAKARQLADDPVMQRAAKKIFLAGIYYNGTLAPGQEPDATRNFTLQLAMTADKSNEQLGADLRGTAEGIIRLEQGFDAIALYKTQAKKVAVDNSKSPR